VQQNNRKGTPVEEEIMDVKLVTNMPVPTPTHIATGLFTAGNFDPPQGQVMKLTTKLDNAPPEEPEQKTPPPLFGAHIREGIAVVKDWMKKP
jgi:hypothetical protein